jgi:hypothetical protein
MTCPHTRKQENCREQTRQGRAGTSLGYQSREWNRKRLDQVEEAAANAITQIRGAFLLQTIESGSLSNAVWRDRITARYRAYGPPTELPELNCWSIEKHAGHLARCNSLTHFAGCVPKP